MKNWRRITLPTVWERTGWGATSDTYVKYEKYFTDNNIVYSYDSSGDPHNPTITYKINCTEEELLLLRLSF